MNTFEIFKISKNQPDRFDFFLDYIANSTLLGIPKRENHKIFELRKEKPIRYKINGKSDFTAGFRRKQRTFYELDYIFEYKGQVEKIEFLNLDEVKKTKEIPLSNCKLINERKLLH